MGNLVSILAELILEKLENQEQIKPLHLQYLDQFPIIDVLREKLNNSQKSLNIILHLLKSEITEEVILGINFTKNYLTQTNENKNKILQLMEDLFEKSNSFYIKITLIQRFLDLPENELKKYKHSEFIYYIIKNFNDFIKLTPTWVPDQTNREKFFKDRIPKNSNSKNIFYLLMYITYYGKENSFDFFNKHIKNRNDKELEIFLEKFLDNYSEYGIHSNTKTISIKSLSNMDITNTIEAFYSAFLQRNIETCKLLLNSEEKKVCIIGSGSTKSTISLGLNETIQHLQMNFQNELPKKVIFSNIQINIIGNLSWFIADRTNVYKDQQKFARLTAVLERKNGKWFINHLHHSFSFK